MAATRDGATRNTCEQLAKNERKSANNKAQRDALRQKREDAACVKTDHPFDERELDNSNACTLCNALFLAPSVMKTHTKNKTCFFWIKGEERDVLLNNISETITKPLVIQATASRFEVTFPPGPLKVDIGVRNMMCVVHQVNNTVEGFPLCANDIIVSVNDTLMAKCEGIHKECVDVFRGSVDKTKKIVILRTHKVIISNFNFHKQRLQPENEE